MNRLTPRLPALAATTLVFLVGLAYVVTRTPSYESTGAFVLAPAVIESSDKAQLIQGFERSGAIGTFVELVASSDTYARAGSPPVTVEARAVPDSRVIDLTATGGERAVQPGLRAVMTSASSSQGALSDLWDLRVLESASVPTVAGASVAVMLLAAALFALLAGVFTYVVLARVPDRAAREPAYDDFGWGAAAEPDEAPRAKARRQTRTARK